MWYVLRDFLYMQKKINPVLLIIIAIFFIVGISFQWSSVVKDIDNYTISATETSDLYEKIKEKNAKPEKREVKGIYLTAYSANSTKKVDSMIDLINKTELNAVVIDIKDYSGYILYDSDVELVNELDTEDNRIKDVSAMIDKFHEHDIYVIARQTVFQDPVLARKKPEWAIKATYGGLWRDHNGLAWVDPTKKEVWEYNVDIAKEAIRLGFDEINFDYVRFPSDGNMRAVVYTNQDQKKYEVMHDFYSYLSDELSSLPAYISLDMFGYVMEKYGEDDINIGQRLVDAVEEVDYICPMMYPSHYPSGHLKLANPAAHPGIVIENGMQKGVPRFENTRAEVRPWIQAFNIGASYGAVNIRAQIDQVEKYTKGGWLLWNAANRYSTAGLKLME